MSRGPAVDLDRHVLGDLGAPVTLLEHGDFECPYCRAAAPVLRQVVESSDGRVRLVIRHFPFFAKHPFALTAALASEAAGERFWAMHDDLFAHQADLSDVALARIGEGLGVTGVVGEPAQRHQPAVAADYREAGRLGVRGTPTLTVDGERYRGRVELGALRRHLGLGR